MTSFALETVDLVKSYGKFRALDGLNLAVPTGSLCALLGRNGAGKTTTIRTLMGMVRPTSGSGHVLGLPFADPAASVEIRRRAAFVDPTSLYPSYTVNQLLRFTSSCYPDWSRERERQGLTALALPENRKVKALSKGMRTKLGVLLAMCRNAELLFFDEPTDGLDPVVREEVLAALVAVNTSRGATVVLSSHQINEMEQIADYLCLVDRGRVVLAGNLDEIRDAHFRIDAAWAGSLPERLLEIPQVISVRPNGSFATLIVQGPAQTVVSSLNATTAQVTPATLREIVLAHAKKDEATADWVSLEGNDALV